MEIEYDFKIEKEWLLTTTVYRLPVIKILVTYKRKAVPVNGIKPIRKFWTVTRTHIQYN